MTSRNSGNLYREEYQLNPRPFDGALEVIQLHSCFHSVLKKGFETRDRRIPYALYSLNLSGSYLRIRDDRQTKVESGTFSMSLGSQNNKIFRVVSQAPLVRKCCMVHRNRIHDAVIACLGLEDGAVVRLNNVAAVAAIMDSIFQIMGDPDYNQAHLASVFFGLLQEVYSQRQNTTLPKPLNQALAYINANFFLSSLSCEDIARQAGVSVRSLNRLFRNHLNSRVVSYINDIRLEHACMLLSRSHLQVNEIAERCGYANACFMSRQFSRKYNCSPSEYRLNA